MHFAFDFEPRYARAARLFGVTPDRAGIEVAHGRLDARFGPWRVTTLLDNVVGVRVTGPYLFVKTAGPARLGITDRGLTFATNHRTGVELTFAEPITGIDPLGVVRHPNLTLTPTDVEGLVAALRPR
ncbi:hypothetical protein [Jatrophihabitans fulvus]